MPSVQEPDDSAECTIAHLTPDPEDDMLAKGEDISMICPSLLVYKRTMVSLVIQYPHSSDLERGPLLVCIITLIDPPPP